MPNVAKDVAVYPIRTAARLSGVSVRRIRAWENQYHLLHPARTNGKHRLYSDDDIERLRQIKAMRDQGMSLLGIQRLYTRERKTAGQ